MSQRSTIPKMPDEDKLVFSEGVDYEKTGSVSIWGSEDSLAREALERVEGGVWLNMCAGDGRFNSILLSRANSVVAADIDPGALDKLLNATDLKQRSRLSLMICNVVERLPFKSGYFDGIFCAGTLHLFPKEIFTQILSEFERILKPNGEVIIDYAADIRRVREDGSLYTVRHEPLYTLNEALNLLKESFTNFKCAIRTDVSEPELVEVRGEKYFFSCNYILVRAKKRT
ncbi:MAG: class I SAM-dependent methyltransferase [bacterium]